MPSSDESAESAESDESDAGLRARVIKRVFSESGDEAEHAGTRIGRFVVLDQVGKGGMGVVYAAYDHRLDRKIAIKLLHDRVGEALVREAQALANVDHRNVITVHEVGEHEGRTFLAMEFFAGETLKEWTQEQRRIGMPWSKVLRPFLLAGRGLAAAHKKRIVHRDFKPENVIVNKDGEVRVVDFGLARPAPDENSARFVSGEISDRPRAVEPVVDEATVSDRIAGTPHYMAPEQRRGEAADVCADQFSFCVALYQGLYGDWPYEGLGSVSSTARRKLRDPPADARVPRWVLKVLRRGLEWDNRKRYPSMDHLLSALQNDPFKIVRKAAVAGLAIGLLGAAGLVWHDTEEAHQGEQARLEEERRIAREQALEEADNTRRREDVLVLREARAWLEEDPTHAIVRLGGLSWAAWRGEARTVASTAVQLGIAERLSWLEEGSVMEALAPNGAEALVRDPEHGTAWLYHLGTGDRRSLLGGKLGVSPLSAFSHDSRMLAVQTDGAVYLVDVASLEVRPLGEGSNEHRRMAFSRDGGVLLVWGGDSDVRGWWTDRKREIRLPGHRPPVEQVAVARHDGGQHRAVTVDVARTIRVWDLENETAREVEGVAPIALSADARLLATTAADTDVWVHDLDEGAKPGRVASLDHAVVAMQFAPDRRRIAVGTGDGYVSVVSVEGEATRERQVHQESVTEVAYADDGAFVVSHATDETLGVWDLADDAVQRLRGHEQIRLWTTAAPDRVVSVGYEGSIRGWRVNRKHPAEAISDAPINLLAWSLDGSAWVAADESGGLSFHPTATHQRSLTHDLEVPAQRLAVSPDGAWVAFVDADGTVSAWQPSEGPPRSLGVLDVDVDGVAFTNVREVAATGVEGIVVWSLPEGKQTRIATPGFQPRAIAKTGGQFRLVGQARDTTTKIYDVGESEPVTHETGIDGSLQVDFARGGELAAIVGFTRDVWVWEEGEPQARLLGRHESSVVGVSVTSDGKVVAAAGEDGTVRIWDVADGQARTVDPGAGQLRSLAFERPDEQMIACGGSDGRLRFIRDQAPHEAMRLWVWVRDLTVLDETNSPWRGFEDE